VTQYQAYNRKMVTVGEIGKDIPSSRDIYFVNIRKDYTKYVRPQRPNTNCGRIMENCKHIISINF
jgi:hypothetical protein